ncbi:hypothetical protein NITHO_3170002 [Nitrolancea hollandica Lb]|uniref:Uncharacterized protein n=1 Tax=Nitrolancea hollandica Lb TaxID=1129897 RepID=I4EHL7_9BACT|nr:hypothetical protein NITHO_3170002 [Nitrolancea hollandica Lb]
MGHRSPPFAPTPAKSGLYLPVVRLDSPHGFSPAGAIPQLPFLACGTGRLKPMLLLLLRVRDGKRASIIRRTGTAVRNDGEPGTAQST